MSIFKDLDACVSPVLSLDEAPNYKHNRERNSFVKLNDGSFLPSMNWLTDMNNEKRSFEMPKIGQHSTSILKEIGYSLEDIKKFQNEGTIQDSCSKKLKSKI